MKYGLIKNGILVQKQLSPEIGFVEIPDDAICGQLYDGVSFTNPPLPAPTYVELRTNAYASQGEQLDMQYHDLVNGTTTWIEHITAIKAKYPKV